MSELNAYTIKSNLWFGNISIIIITVHIIIKTEIYLFIYVYVNNSFSLVQLTQIMDINHFIIHYLLFIHKDRRPDACDCWKKPFILSDKYKRNNVNNFNETVQNENTKVYSLNNYLIKLYIKKNKFNIKDRFRVTLLTAIWFMEGLINELYIYIYFYYI